MNKTLIERVRYMLSEARLPKHFWGEALYTVVHVINISPAIALNTEVPDNIWFDKDVKYDHLRVFGCKAFVHVPKDERSKLDMKTRQCIFIGYGHDKYGYRMYDLVEKKLARSCDVQFMKDQTIEDIDKVKKSTPEKENSLSEIDPVQMHVHDLDIVDNNVQNGDQHNYVGDQQLGDGFDVPLDDDVEEEQKMSQDENMDDAPKSPPMEENLNVTKSSWRVKRGKRLGNLNCRRRNLVLFRTNISAIHLRKNSTFHSRSKHVDLRYQWICDALDAKLLKLAKVHTDDIGADMMTKVVPRGKFEACCEIVGLAITST
ncbi:hypothetical protein CR513_17579, partial [Mucuna pruriens]